MTPPGDEAATTRIADLSGELEAWALKIELAHIPELAGVSWSMRMRASDLRKLSGAAGSVTALADVTEADLRADWDLWRRRRATQGRESADRATPEDTMDAINRKGDP